MKRLTAEEVASESDELSKQPGLNIDWTSQCAYADAADKIRDNLVPQWQDEPDEDTHAVCPWWWVEELGADSPPQKLRSYRPLKINPEDSTFFVAMNEPRKYDRWTVSGWVPLVGRVCPIGARPST